MKWTPSQNQKYFLSIDSKLAPLHKCADEQWIDSVAHQCCLECNYPNADWYPRPFDAIVKRQLKASVTLCNLIGPVVVKAELASVLKDYNTTAVWGKCYYRESQSDDLEIIHYNTVYDKVKNMVKVRSEALDNADASDSRLTHSGYLECSECGQRAPAYRGNLFVTKRSLGDREWFLEGVGIYISPKVDAKIDWSKFPDIQKYRVWVRDDIA